MEDCIGEYPIGKICNKILIYLIRMAKRIDVYIHNNTNI